MYLLFFVYEKNQRPSCRWFLLLKPPPNPGPRICPSQEDMRRLALRVLLLVALLANQVGSAKAHEDRNAGAQRGFGVLVA